MERKRPALIEIRPIFKDDRELRELAEDALANCELMDSICNTGLFQYESASIQAEYEEDEDGRL